MSNRPGWTLWGLCFLGLAAMFCWSCTTPAQDSPTARAETPDRPWMPPTEARVSDQYPYDPGTAVTETGQVDDIGDFRPVGSAGTPVGRKYIRIKVGDGMRVVQLGPRKYMESLPVKIEKGDTVEVTGSVSTIGGTQVLIARELTKAGKTVTLRDPQGVPLWRSTASSPASPAPPAQTSPAPPAQASPAPPAQASPAPPAAQTSPAPPSPAQVSPAPPSPAPRASRPSR